MPKDYEEYTTLSITKKVRDKLGKVCQKEETFSECIERLIEGLKC